MKRRRFFTYAAASLAAIAMPASIVRALERRADPDRFAMRDMVKVWKPMTAEEFKAMTQDERHYLAQVFPGGNWFGSDS